MLYLAIETSCDETSIALLWRQNVLAGNFVDFINSVLVLGQVVSSQIKIHAEYGGVVPEIGARLHANQIHFLLDEVLRQAFAKLKHKEWNSVVRDFAISGFEQNDFKIILAKLDKIFVTTEPGLPSALKVGHEFARSLEFFINNEMGGHVVLQPVNHLRGHVASSYFNSVENI